MISKITISNFKKLENITFSLAQSVVLIGPNNSGKSTIFQALCLWEIGVKNYIQAYQKKDLNKKNGAVTINRKDIINSPISDARFLWRDRKVTHKDSNNHTKHIVLSVELIGENDGVRWQCKSEFEFSNAESFICKVTGDVEKLIAIYNNDGVHFGFLQPMSGISTNEDKLTQGSIARRLGEGKTAEVLRNICFEILYPEIPRPQNYNIEEKWEKLNDGIKKMFGVSLQKPEFIKATGIIQLEYIENGNRYDISSGGRGFQQTLLLLAYMYANPKTILLLDEPDAHLEVIRQREVFQLVNDIANDVNSQLIIASHSEVVLEEAAEASKVIALIENTVFEINEASTPQKLKHIKKSLTEIGWEKYYLARVKNHVVYLEGSTDLQMLQVFARKLNHKVANIISKANVQYTSDNVPNTAVSNFVSLKEIFPELQGIALFDHLPNLADNPKLKIICWKKRELENYFARPAVLIKHAKLLSYNHTHLKTTDLQEVMELTVKDSTAPIYLNDLTNPWWDTAKLSDDWLDIIFKEFYKRIGLSHNFYKRDYYNLINLLELNEIDEEVSSKLDLLYEVIKT